MKDPDIAIVATQHPSLDDMFSDFLTELRAEPRYFGPTGRSNPKPFPSLIEGLADHGEIRLAALGCDRVVGACRVDSQGDVLLAVTRGRRRQGIATALLLAVVERAAHDGWTRLTIRASHRSTAIRKVAERLGAVAVEVGRGQVEMLLDVNVVAARASA